MQTRKIKGIEILVPDQGPRDCMITGIIFSASTVAIPLWVKHGIDAWMIAAKIEDGRLLRPLSKSGKD
jgi:hypothetical protein